MLGIFSLSDAIQQAEDLGLDVVLISPDADPPVCRIMDASRHKYELDKRDKEAKKKQREARCVHKHRWTDRHGDGMLSTRMLIAADVMSYEPMWCANLYCSAFAQMAVCC